jgi:hypothetical protein
VAKVSPRTKSGQKVLGALSVARHSLAYWQNYENEVSSNWVYLPWHWRLFWVVRADILGWLWGWGWGPSAVVSYHYWWWLWWWWWKW